MQRETIILIIGLAANVLTAASSVPQIIKAIKNKSTEGVSLITNLTLLIVFGLWLVYGTLQNNLPESLPILIGNSIGVTVFGTMTILKIINMIKKGEKASLR